MTVVARGTVAALLALSLAACSSSEPAATGTSEAPTVQATPTAGGAGATELTGMFEGVFHFEAQCFYLATADTRYSLSVPDGYSIEPDGKWDPSSSQEAAPVLHGADGAVVANAGDTITVTGAVEELPPGGPCGTTQILRAETVVGA